jgi:hypothetical protein
MDDNDGSNDCCENDDNDEKYTHHEEDEEEEYERDSSLDDEEDTDTTDCERNQYNISCEQARLLELVTYLRSAENVTLPIGVIRYNPNRFKVDGVRQPDISQIVREAALAEVIENWQSTTDLDIQYMYYNAIVVPGTGENDKALVTEITLHKEYDPRIAALVRNAIV